MEKNTDLLLNIDETITRTESFRKIMDDGIVTDDELREQSERVAALLAETEKRFQAEDLELIQQLFAETNVLSAIFHYHELQNLRYYGSL
jgi:hypothetical protein